MSTAMLVPVPIAPTSRTLKADVSNWYFIPKIILQKLETCTEKQWNDFDSMDAIVISKFRHNISPKLSQFSIEAVVLLLSI